MSISKRSLVVMFSIFLLISMPSGWAFSGAGSGTSEDPFQITSIEELNEIRDNVTADYELQNSLDFCNENDYDEPNSLPRPDEFCKDEGAEFGWDPIDSFEGSLNGNDFTISNLFINRSGGNAFFDPLGGGSITEIRFDKAEIIATHSSGVISTGVQPGSEMTNIMITDSIVNVSSTTNSRVGLLAGITSSNGATTVRNVSVQGSVILDSPHSSARAGGMIATFRTDGSIAENVYADVHVKATGDANAGGLFGNVVFESPVVNNSYSIGLVEAENGETGGLVEDLGSGATVSNSFWDTETSNQTTSAAGTGKTTAQMQSITTYTDTETEGLDVPWDITLVDDWDGETWFLDEGNDYPRLSNELTFPEVQTFDLDETLFDSNDIRDIEFSPSNVRRLAYSTGDGRVIVRFKDSGVWELEENFSIYTNTARDIAWSPDGDELAVTENAGNVSIWETTGWTNTHNLSDVNLGGDELSVATAVDYSEDGSWIAYGVAVDDRVYIFDTTDYSFDTALTHYSGSINDLEFSKENQWLGVAANNDNVYLQEFGNSWSTEWILTAGDSTNGIGFNEFDELIGLANSDDNIYFYDISDPTDVSIDNTRTQENKAGDFVEFSGDNRFVSYNNENEVEVIHIDANNVFQQRETLTDSPSPNIIRDGSFNAVSELFAFGDNNGTVFIYETPNSPNLVDPIGDVVMPFDSTRTIDLKDHFDNFDEIDFEFTDEDGVDQNLGAGQSFTSDEYDVEVSIDFVVTIESKETELNTDFDVTVFNDWGSAFDTFNVDISEDPPEQIASPANIFMDINEAVDRDAGDYFINFDIVELAFTSDDLQQSVILNEGETHDDANFNIELRTDDTFTITSKDNAHEFDLTIRVCDDDNNNNACDVGEPSLEDTLTVFIEDTTEGGFKPNTGTDVIRSLFNQLFGFEEGSNLGLYIFSFILTLTVVGLVGFFTNSWLAIMSGVGSIIIFGFVGWFPLWAAIVLSLVAIAGVKELGVG